MIPRLEGPICGSRIPEADKRDNRQPYHEAHCFVSYDDISVCGWCGTGFFTSLMLHNNYLKTVMIARAMIHKEEIDDLGRLAAKLSEATK